MAIRFSKYVAIVSGVGGSSGVQTRQLIGRLISSDPRIDPATVLEFTSAADVGEFFGSDSPEYQRALLYFSYTSPAISAARRISFSRYAPTGAAAAIFGGGPVVSLATLKTATAGVLSFVFDGGAPVTVSAINLAAAASFAEVASLIQTALNADADPHLDNATVTYDAVNAAFKFDAGVIDGATISLAPAGAAPNDLRTALGWTPNAGVIFTRGVAAQSPTDAVTASINTSNNFGSFAFIDDLTILQHADVAALNAGQNVMFQYLVPLRDKADAASWSAALFGFEGVGLTLSPITTEFPELIPMIQLAATDYDRTNAVVNYMFKQFGGVSASVTTDADSDSMDSMRVNYYGRTQTAGQLLEFYQRGLLMGPSSAPVDMNVYANEQWLKDAVAARLMGLLLSSTRVPANSTGRGQILAVVQGSIDSAINNGTISVGKSLTTDQKLFVTQQTNDPLAWHQVQNVGYWIDATIVPYTGPGGTQEYKAVYSLIYSKDDAIRLIEGTHNLV